jgi:hypothetical protein
VDLGDDILAVDFDDGSFGCAERGVQHGSLLSNVDFFAGEHGVDALAQAARLCQIEEQAQRLIGDAVFRVVEVDALGFGSQPRSALGVALKQLAQMAGADGFEVGLQRFPGGK